MEHVIVGGLLSAKLRIEEKWDEAMAALGSGNNNTPIQGGVTIPEQERVLGMLENDDEYQYFARFVDKIERCIRKLDGNEKIIAAMIAEGVPDEQIMRELKIDKRKFYSAKNAAMLKLARMTIGHIVTV